MQYKLKVIIQDPHRIFGKIYDQPQKYNKYNYSVWWKSKRGFEAWTNGDLFSNINEAFRRCPINYQDVAYVIEELSE